MVAASHMWIFKLNFELNLNKTEDNPSILPVTFQVLSGHMWQVATSWTVTISNVSIVVKGPVEQCCSKTPSGKT